MFQIIAGGITLEEVILGFFLLNDIKVSFLADAGFDKSYNYLIRVGVDDARWRDLK